MENIGPEELIKTKVAKRLKAIRMSCGYTQEVVRDCMNEINIGRIESGMFMTKLTTIEMLCKFYGITLEEFFRGM